MTCDSLKDYKMSTRINGKLTRVPKIRLEAARKSFYFQGANKYNKLPVDIRDKDSAVIFKNFVRSHFL